MNTIQETGYYVCHNGGSIIQYFDLTNGGTIYTGIEFHEKFDAFEDAKARVNELANDENYFDDNFVIKEPQRPN